MLRMSSILYLAMWRSRRGKGLRASGCGLQEVTDRDIAIRHASVAQCSPVDWSLQPPLGVSGGIEGVAKTNSIFVQCPTDNAAGGADARQLFDIVPSGDAAGGNHGNVHDLNHLLGGGKVRSGQHAVGGNVRVNDRGEWQTLELSREIRGRDVTGLQPAVRGHAAGARVDPEG